MNRTTPTVYIAGAGTLIGAAVRRRLLADGYGVLEHEPDPTDARQVEDFFAEHRPGYVVVAAGPSGGIAANQSRPATLMQQNLVVAANLLEQAHRHGVRRLLYLASSCCYPPLAPQPLAVESLFTGPLEPTSAPFAQARLAGITLCDAYRRQHGVDFVAGIPADVFGPGDDFSPEGSHVLPALIRKFHEARSRHLPSVTLWGSGRPRREFLFADDLADACLTVLRCYPGPGPINLGGGTELAIAEAAAVVAEVVGYHGRIEFDPSRPDGAPRKALDAGPLLGLGWRPRTEFCTAVARTYLWFLQHVAKEDPGHAREALSLAVSRPAS